MAPELSALGQGSMLGHARYFDSGDLNFLARSVFGPFPATAVGFLVDLEGAAYGTLYHQGYLGGGGMGLGSYRCGLRNVDFQDDRTALTDVLLFSAAIFLAAAPGTWSATDFYITPPPVGTQSGGRVQRVHALVVEVFDNGGLVEGVIEAKLFVRLGRRGDE